MNSERWLHLKRANSLKIFSSRLTLDEIAAAAELILAQDVAEGKQEEASGSESSDEGFGGEVESDSEEDQMEADLTTAGVEDLGDSGYGTMETRWASYRMLTYLLFSAYPPVLQWMRWVQMLFSAWPLAASQPRKAKIHKECTAYYYCLISFLLCNAV